MDARNATQPDMSTYLGIDMGPLLGSLFWGTLISMMLAGMTIIQAYHYFPGRDRLAVRLIALSMVLMDIFSSALVSQGLYHYLLPNFGSTLPFRKLVPTLAAECVITTCIITISQLYFAWQVRSLAQKPFIKYTVSATVVVLALLAFAGGIGCAVVMFVRPSNIFSARSHLFIAMAAVAKAPAALADIIVTCSLCYILGYAKTGVKATDSVLKTLTAFVIQRGVLVALVQTALLTMFYVAPSHVYWLGLHVNVTRVYSNTFFAMLNSRDGLKRELETKSFVTSSFATRSPSTLGKAIRVSRQEHDGDTNGAELQSVWIDTIKGGDSTDSVAVAQIQVDRNVVVSAI